MRGSRWPTTPKTEMAPRRLYRWIDIAGWTLGEAYRAGELRALCPRPDCEYGVRSYRAPPLSADVRLFEIARRMCCTGCGRKGAHIEIWTSGAIGGARAADASKLRPRGN